MKYVRTMIRLHSLPQGLPPGDRVEHVLVVYCTVHLPYNRLLDRSSLHLLNIKCTINLQFLKFP